MEDNQVFHPSASPETTNTRQLWIKLKVRCFDIGLLKWQDMDECLTGFSAMETNDGSDAFSLSYLRQNHHF